MSSSQPFFCKELAPLLKLLWIGNFNIAAIDRKNISKSYNYKDTIRTHINKLCLLHVDITTAFSGEKHHDKRTTPWIFKTTKKIKGFQHPKNELPGHSKWPFDSLVGGHLTFEKGSRFHHPKKVTSRIARYIIYHKHQAFMKLNIPFVPLIPWVWESRFTFNSWMIKNRP